MQRLLAQTIAHLQAFGLMLPSSASLAASPAQSNTSFTAPGELRTLECRREKLGETDLSIEQQNRPLPLHLPQVPPPPSFATVATILLPTLLP